MSTLLTVEDIALRVHCSERSVRKRLEDARSFFAGKAPREKGAPGRAANLYRAEVVPALWGSNYGVHIVEAAPIVRRERSDRGKARGKSQALVDLATRYAFTEYMSAAIPDVRGAVRRAIRKLHALAEKGALPISGNQVEEVEKLERSEWLYKKWIYSNTRSFIGPYYTQLWKAAWESEYKKHTQALQFAGVRYVTWEILENGFGVGPGNGFARFVMLDDRLSDVRTGDGKQSYAIYAWCVLSGALLWVEPCETVTAQSYIRAILAVVAAHGLQERAVWFMENAKAAVAKRVEGIIRSLYSDAELANPGSAHKQLFHTDSYVVRNIPSIPKGFGKAFGERSFLRLKTGYDALTYPTAFQGGNRTETIQLTRSQNPVFRDVPSVEAYFRRLLGFAYTEYSDTPRPSLHEWAAAHESLPTIRAMMEYYRPAECRKPTAEQIAYLLYWAQTSLTIVTHKTAGAVTCQIGGQFYNLRHNALYDPHLTRKKIAIVPIPDNPDMCALYLYDAVNPRFLCVAENFRARTVEDAGRFQRESRRMREDFADRVETSKKGLLITTSAEIVQERQAILDAAVPPAQELPAWAQVQADGSDDCEIIEAEVCSDEDDDNLIDDINSLDI